MVITFIGYLMQLLCHWLCVWLLIAHYATVIMLEARSKRGKGNDLYFQVTGHIPVPEILVCGNRNFRSYWLLWPWIWPDDITNLTHIAWRYTACKTSIGNDCSSIKYRAMKFACSMGFLTMEYRFVWPPSLSCDQNWSRITKCMHSPVVGLRLEGNLVFPLCKYLWSV